MHVGAALFFTAESIRPADLARALEDRGFESLWAPEHSHIPLTRSSPWPQGGQLPSVHKEIVLMKRLAHPNIVQYFGSL